MNVLVLKPLQHRGMECIGIYFEHSSKINGAIRKNAGAKWSQTKKCWYTPLSEEYYKRVKNAVQGIARIDHTTLKQYLEKRKTTKPAPSSTPVIIKRSLPVSLKKKEITAVDKNFAKGVHPVNRHVLPAMKEQLLLKAYSASTIKTYLNEMTQLLYMLGNIPADALEPEHLRRYLVHCYEKIGLKENTLHSRMNAMKFYYEQVLKREKFFWEIPRPKKQLILPKVLSDAEVARLFRVITNLKHKAILFTAYSAGLRVSEVVNLKIRDIDSSRMTIFVEKAKGKKDRIVNLSPLLLDILRSYLKKTKPRPQVYLFESVIAGEPYSIRSSQIIFNEARKKAGINKNVSFHALRHSFATHLLEKGVDIRYIKDILGHFNIKTTERYTHVSRRMLVNIVSPLDDLFSKGIL